MPHWDGRGGSAGCPARPNCSPSTVRCPPTYERRFRLSESDSQCSPGRCDMARPFRKAPSGSARSGRTMPPGSTQFCRPPCPPLRCGREDDRCQARRGVASRDRVWTLDLGVPGVAGSSPTNVTQRTLVVSTRFMWSSSVATSTDMQFDECHRRDQNEMLGHRSRMTTRSLVCCQQARPAGRPRATRVALR